MNPIKDLQQQIQEAKPFESLNANIRYSDDILTKNNKKWLNACTGKLAEYENRRLEFDASLELAGSNSKPTQAFNYIKTRTESVTNDTISIKPGMDLTTEDDEESAVFDQNTIKMYESVTAHRRKMELNSLVNQISSACSRSCFDYKTITTTISDAENECISKCADITQKVNKMIMEQVNISCNEALIGQYIDG